MTTASQTAAPTLACPPWCTNTEEQHSWQLTDDRGPIRCHDGPDWGPPTRCVRVGGDQLIHGTMVNVEIMLDLASATPELTVVEARQFAADLLAAAEWLEANA